MGITYPASTSHDRIWEHIQTVADDVNTLFVAQPGTWTDYSPTWASSGTAPAYGNAVITSRYLQPANSKLVIYKARIVFGTTTTFGTGTYNFSMPVTPGNTGSSTFNFGTAYFRDASATSIGHFPGLVFNDPAGATVGFAQNNAQIGQTVPFTWANTDWIGWELIYEAA